MDAGEVPVPISEPCRNSQRRDRLKPGLRTTLQFSWRSLAGTGWRHAAARDVEDHAGGEIETAILSDDFIPIGRIDDFAARQTDRTPGLPVEDAILQWKAASPDFSSGEQGSEAEREGVDNDSPVRPPNRTWAMLIKRVYEVDPLACPKCDGQMKVIAFIEPPQGAVIEKILRHCALWRDSSPRPPPGEAGLVVTHKSGNDPIQLAWMVKEAGQLTPTALRIRPHPARLDGESGCPASPFLRRSRTTSFTHGTNPWGSFVFFLSVLNDLSQSWDADAL